VAQRRDRKPSRAQARKRAGRTISPRSSRSLPSGEKLELDLRLTNGEIERGLTQARGCADAKRIEQFENAALARVVADLRNTLNLGCTAHGLSAITLGSITPFDHHRAQRR